MSDDLAKGSSQGYANCCAALAKADLREHLKNAKIPMLVIGGKQDPVTTVVDAQAIVDVAPNAQLATINASHIANVEKVEDFIQILRKYF